MKFVQFFCVLVALKFSSAFWFSEDYSDLTTPAKKPRAKRQVTETTPPPDYASCINQNKALQTSVTAFKNLAWSVSQTCSSTTTAAPTTTAVTTPASTTKAPTNPVIPSFPEGRFPNKGYKCPYAGEYAYPIYAENGAFLKAVCDYRAGMLPMNAELNCRKYGMQQYSITRQEELTQIIEYMTSVYGVGTGVISTIGGALNNGTWTISNPGLGALFPGAYPQSSSANLGNCLRLQGTGTTITPTTVQCNSGANYAYCEWDLISKYHTCPTPWGDFAQPIYKSDGTYVKSLCILLAGFNPLDAKIECRKYGMQLFAFTKQDEFDQVIKYHYQRFGYSATINVNGNYKNSTWSVYVPEQKPLLASATPTDASAGNCMLMQGLGSSIITKSAPCSSGGYYAYCEWVKSPYDMN